MRRPLKVTICSGQNLMNCDKESHGDGGLSDPYIMLAVMPHKTFRQTFRFDSRVEDDTLDPVWNQTFLIPGCEGNAALYFTCIDYDHGEIR
jgi:Ca2+-dependent lipid-binding protein